MAVWAFHPYIKLLVIGAFLELAVSISSQLEDPAQGLTGTRTHPQQTFALYSVYSTVTTTECKSYIDAVRAAHG